MVTPAELELLQRVGSLEGEVARTRERSWGHANEHTSRGNDPLIEHRGQGYTPLSDDYYNGTIVQPITFVVTSDGATITGTLDANPSGDMTQRFSDGYSTLSSGATVTLTAGTATVPKKRFVYILQSAKGTLVEADAWPAAEHIQVAETVVQTAALVQSDGELANRNWNNMAKGTDGQGHHTHAWERLRWEHSAYFSGSAVTWTITTNAGAIDNIDLAITAGKVYQLHLQDVDAFDTTTSAEVLVPNDNATPYTATADIEDLLTDSAGVSMETKYFNLVVWCSVSSGSETERVFINLPSGSYNKQSDATNDVDGHDNYTIPSDFRGYAFLVNRITLRHQAAASGTFTNIQEVDLRGQVPNIVAGSGTAAITTEFADGNFRIFDDGDPTKELAFEASGISPSTTRTLTVPNANGTLLLAESNESVSGLWDFPAISVGSDAPAPTTNKLLQLDEDKTDPASIQGFDIDTATRLTHTSSVSRTHVSARIAPSIAVSDTMTLSGEQIALLSGWGLIGPGTIAQATAWAPSNVLVLGGLVTDLRAIHVTNTLITSGTLTNQYGIDIDALTSGGTLNIGIRNNAVSRLVGNVKIGADSAPAQALDVTGNIAVTGTVDGVDIAARDHAQEHGVADHTAVLKIESPTITAGGIITPTEYATLQGVAGNGGAADDLIGATVLGDGAYMVVTAGSSEDITVKDEGGGTALEQFATRDNDDVVLAVPADDVIAFVYYSSRWREVWRNITGATGVAGHGIAQHTEHANWKVLYTDGSGDEQELALGADGTVLAGAGAAAAPVMEEIFTTHIGEFPALGEDLATGVMGGRPGKNTGESGEHGTFTAIRAIAAAGTAGTGTNTILIEADDNPAFSSATTLFTLNLGTSTEVQDATLDNAWASGDIWIRARCTAVGGAPKDVNVFFIWKERAEAF